MGVGGSVGWGVYICVDYGVSNDSSVDKGVKYGVGVVVGDSLGWVVDRGVVSWVDSDDDITFELGGGSEMGSYGVLFDGFNFRKPVCSLLDESLEQNYGYLIDLSYIEIDLNSGAKRSVG